MTAGIDWARLTWAIGLAALAAPIGFVAGFDPGLAITVALATCFALIAFSNLAMGLSLYVLISFVALHPYGLYDALARIVLGLAWFALIATRGRRGFDALSGNAWATAALALLVGWAALSAIWSESSSEALEATRQYAASAMLFLIVVTAVRSRVDLSRVMAGFVTGALLAAAIGVVAPAEDSSEGRLSSAILDPNLLAGSLVAAVALAAGLFVLHRSGPARLLSGLAIGLSLIALWLTGSRGGLVAMAVVMLAAIALAAGRRLRIAAAALALVAASLVFFAAFAPDQLSDRLTQPTRGEERIQEGRSTIWQVAWRGFEANPVNGLGAGNFRVSSRHYVLQPGTLARTDEVIERPAVAHNAHLEVLSELGLVGFAFYLGLIGACLGSMIVAARRFGARGDEAMRAAAICVTLALVGILAANTFFSDQYGKQLWLLLGLGPALLAIAGPRRADVPRG